MKTKERVIVVAMAMILALLPVSAKAGWFMGIGSTDDCKCCDGKAADCSQSKPKKPAAKSKPKPEKKIVATTAADDAKLKSLVDRAEKAAERSEAGADRSEKAANRSEAFAKDSAASASASKASATRAEEAEKRVELFSKEVIDRIAKSAKDGRIPNTETKTEAKAEVKAAPKKEVEAIASAAEPKQEIKKETVAEVIGERCVGAGTIATGLGTGATTAGVILISSNPAGWAIAGGGAILTLTGIWDEETWGKLGFRKSNPKCKATAGLLGGLGGLATLAIDAKDHHSSSDDGSSPGDPPSVPDDGTGTGPGMPPPVPAAPALALP